MTVDLDADPDAQAPGEAEGPDAELPGNEDAPPAREPEPRVPLSRLNRLGAKLGGEIESLRAKVAELEAQKAPAKITKAQLEAEVDAGKLSREQADAAWERQLKAEVIAEVTAGVKQESHQQTLSNQLLAYEAAVPELANQDSETFSRVADEYRALLATGLPTGPATQLAACRAVLGSIGALKNVRKAPAPRHESHEDGGSGGGGGEHGQKPKRPALSEKQKNYYRGLIAKGVLPSWDAAYKEVEDGQKARGAAGF